MVFCELFEVDDEITTKRLISKKYKKWDWLKGVGYIREILMTLKSFI